MGLLTHLRSSSEIGRQAVKERAQLPSSHLTGKCSGHVDCVEGGAPNVVGQSANDARQEESLVHFTGRVCGHVVSVAHALYEERHVEVARQ